MKIRYFSDLHLEFIEDNEMNTFLKQIPLPNNNEKEICILAGDIGHPHDNKYDIFMKFISNHFTKSFVISGNHEYYHNTRTIEETNQFMENYFIQYENISFLHNTYEYYENKCFIGSVLWSNIKEPKYTINDTKMIPHLDVDKYNQMNKECVAFLEKTIQTNENCVVITHHMPSHSLIDQKYKNPILLPYNQWFYCDMESLFVPQIKAWFYGHTHMPSSKKIKEIPFICNPIGYPGENNKNDFSLHIII